MTDERRTAKGMWWDRAWTLTKHVEALPEMLDRPLHVRKPTTWAVWNDLFHESITNTFIDQVWAVMTICAMHANRYEHTFQILTKRPERAREYVPSLSSKRIAQLVGEMMEDGDRWFDNVWHHMPKPLPNAWLGASASTQADLERVVPDLLATPAAVRFLSLEPLLDAVDLTRVGGDGRTHWNNTLNGCLNVVGTHVNGRQKITIEITEPPRPRLDWVIVGCESGSNRRGMNIEWARSIKEQCWVAGVPLFMKQLDINGRVSKDMSEWPEDLRVREMPK